MNRVGFNEKNGSEQPGFTNPKKLIVGLIFISISLCALVLAVVTTVRAPDPQTEIVNSGPSEYLGDDPESSCLFLNDLTISNTAVNYSLLISNFHTVILTNVSINVSRGNVLTKDAVLVNNVKSLKIINCTFICTDGLVLRNVKNSCIDCSNFVSVIGVTAENSAVCIKNSKFDCSFGIRAILSSFTISNTTFYNENVLAVPFESEFQVNENIYCASELISNRIFEYNPPYAISTTPLTLFDVWCDSNPKFPIELVPKIFDYRIDSPTLTNETTATIEITVTSRFLTSVSISGINLEGNLIPENYSQNFVYTTNLTSGSNDFTLAISAGENQIAEQISIFRDNFPPIFTQTGDFSGVYGEKQPVLRGTISDHTPVHGKIRLNGTEIDFGLLSSNLNWNFENWGTVANNSEIDIQLILIDSFYNTVELEFSITKRVVVPQIFVQMEHAFCNSLAIVLFNCSADKTETEFYLDNQKIDITTQQYSETLNSFLISDFESLAEGTHTVKISATINGTTRSASAVFVKDTIRPEISIRNATVNRNSRVAVLLRGTVIDENPVEIYLGTALLYSTAVGGNDFSIVIDTEKFTLKIVDAAGNTNFLEFDFQLPAYRSETPGLLLGFVILASISIGSFVQTARLNKKLRGGQ